MVCHSTRYHNKKKQRLSTEQGIVVTPLQRRRASSGTTIPKQLRGFLYGHDLLEAVLIVEDELTTRDALIELLEKDGRAIVTAGDGQEAFERLREVRCPCLILLDLSMPRMNGCEFLQRQSS
jgi:PleD family two-component response regulator